jgi:hypothetical protein
MDIAFVGPNHCIVARFAPTPLAIFADLCRSLQTIANRCIVAIISCNDCNDATIRKTPRGREI